MSRLPARHQLTEPLDQEPQRSPSGLSPLPHTRVLERNALMTLRTLILFYRQRLKVHAAQELLAGVGVGIAVALVFAVLVANSSITSSASAVVRAVVGPADLQLRARGLDGVSESLVGRVGHLPGVKQAAPLLEVNGTIVTGNKRTTVTVAGTNLTLARMDGLIHTLPLEVLSPGGIGISRATAGELHLPPRATEPPLTVMLKMRGRAIPLKLSAVLGHESAGALSEADVAVMPLARLQKIAGLKNRITRVLVQSEPGHRQSVEQELRSTVAGKLTVATATQDLSLLHQALQPSNQASDLFAGLSALLGFLFAFNAMLLTVPERRAAIADLRLEGATRAAVAQMVVFQGLCLGVAASIAGLVGGYFLATGLFHQSSPGYLAQAFTLGTSTIIGLKPILLSLAGGTSAACLASLVPLRDLRRGKAPDAALHKGNRRAPGAIGAQRLLPVSLVALLGAAGALIALLPQMALIACAMVAAATVIGVPLMLGLVLRSCELITARNQQLSALPLALTAMKTTTLRSLALAATGAVALFGSIALGGARDDLLRALHGFASTYSAEAPLWVTNPHDTAAANDFVPASYAGLLEHTPGVAKVETYQSQFMVVGSRRVWVIARPPETNPELLRSQIVTGNPSTAQSEMARPGWIAVSKQIAAEQHAQIGGRIALPTPSGVVRFRLAATTTNLGWTSGVVLMNTIDYSRFWRTSAPTALGIQLQRGASLTGVHGEIDRELGTNSGLEAITAQTRAERFDGIAGEGLGQLGEITWLLVAAAILAMAAALGSSLWQRRVSLAELRLEGSPRGQIRCVLLAEATMMLSAGCLTGALTGFYGQVVIDGYLSHVTGFPVAGAASGFRPVEIFFLVVAFVLVIVAIPGWLASRVPAKLALNE
jgi:putative ABC transport system permease protein